jgi:ribonuclease P protein component
VDHRLKKQKAIEKVFADGKTLFMHPVKAAWLMLDHGEAVDVSFRYAVTVPKRLFRKAADRNLLKRRMRESVRVMVPGGTGQKTMAVVFIYVSREAESFKEIDRAIRVLMKRLNAKYQP